MSSPVEVRTVWNFVVIISYHNILILVQDSVWSSEATSDNPALRRDKRTDGCNGHGICRLYTMIGLSLVLYLPTTLLYNYTIYHETIPVYT